MGGLRKSVPWMGGIALILLAVVPAWGASCSVTSTVSLDFRAAPDDDDCPRDLETFGQWAWQTFKFLVWPASDAMRGQPDETRSLREMKGPRVFETYKSDWEAFPENGAAPLSWNAYPATAAMCTNEPPIAYPDSGLVLGSLHEFGNILMPDFRFVAVLMAQNGKPVRYLPGFDQKEFSLIEANKLYIPSNVPRRSGEAPSGTTKASPGTIVVKSAWIETDGLAADSFHTRTALVQDLDGRCRETTVGLVGLHVMRKTTASPQWIWASFEHVWNVPRRAETARAGFTFNNGSDELMSEEPPLAARDPSQPGWQFPSPYNVERIHPIEDALQLVNADWRAALQGSVWANYELVLVQWPGLPRDESRSGLGEPYQGANGMQIVGANPTPPCVLNDPGNPRNLANSVMEPFGQTGIGCTTNSKRTCMGCHNGARSSDFIFALPLNAPDKAAHVVPLNRRSTIDYLRDVTEWKALPGRPK